MADCLADSNLLLRLCNASDPNYQVAKNALDRLKAIPTDIDPIFVTADSIAPKTKFRPASKQLAPKN